MPGDFNHVPYVFVEIGYRIDSCHVPASIIIDDYVFVDDADYWFTRYFSPDSMGTGIHYRRFDVNVYNAISMSGCGYESSTPGHYVPPTLAQMKKGIKDAIEKLRDSLGNPALGDYEIHFKGSCRSLVGLRFPTGDYYTQMKDIIGGGTYLDTIYFSPGTIIYQSIPCSDGCCKIRYHWQTDSIFNGVTYSSWHPVSTAGDGVSCPDTTLPDYNIYPDKIQVQRPGGGTDYGTVVSQEPCEPICGYFYSPPPPTGPVTSVESDILSQDKALQLSAAPLPFGNYIRLFSNKNISNALAVVYDLNGKKVLDATCLENGQLNTSKLKAGVYYIQVWFPDNTIKTIKVIKQ